MFDYKLYWKKTLKIVTKIVGTKQTENEEHLFEYALSAADYIRKIQMWQIYSTLQIAFSLK